MQMKLVQYPLPRVSVASTTSLPTLKITSVMFLQFSVLSLVHEDEAEMMGNNQLIVLPHLAFNFRPVYSFAPSQQQKCVF
jgi:hypothetical protein